MKQLPAQKILKIKNSFTKPKIKILKRQTAQKLVQISVHSPLPKRKSLLHSKKLLIQSNLLLIYWIQYLIKLKMNLEMKINRKKIIWINRFLIVQIFGKCPKLNPLKKNNKSQPKKLALLYLLQKHSLLHILKQWIRSQSKK